VAATSHDGNRVIDDDSARRPARRQHELAPLTCSFQPLHRGEDRVLGV